MNPTITIFASELATIMTLKPKTWDCVENVEARLLAKHCPEAGVVPKDYVMEARETAVSKLVDAVDDDGLATLLVSAGREEEATALRGKTLSKASAAATVVDVHTTKATNAEDAYTSISETKAAMPTTAAAYVAEATRCKAYTDRGTMGEASVLERWCKQESKTAHKPSRFFCKQVVPGLRLGGYVDGITSDNTKIIEIKKRQRGFFASLRAYEKAQIHAYLYSVGLKSCLLVEEYKGEFQTTCVKWDAAFWEEACEALNLFRDRVYATISSHKKK